MGPGRPMPWPRGVTNRDSRVPRRPSAHQRVFQSPCPWSLDKGEVFDRFEVGEGPVVFNAVQVDIDPATGRALAIERIQRLVEV